jgi:hypothetical protein
MTKGETDPIKRLLTEHREELAEIYTALPIDCCKPGMEWRVTNGE